MNNSENILNNYNKKHHYVKGTRPFSISRSLTLGLASSAVLVSSITISIFYFSAIHEQETSLTRKADENKNYLIGNLERPMWNYDDSTVKAICRTFSYNELVVKLVVTDGSGSIVYKFDKGNDRDTLERAGNIYSKSKLVGKFELAFTKRHIKEAGRKFLTDYVIIMIFITTSLILLTYLFLSIFLKKPIDILDKIVQPYAEGLYTSPVPELPYVEFQKIGKTLSRMRETIRQQIKEIGDAERKYHSIFENAMEGIFQSTPEGHYLSVNPAFARIHGFDSPEEFIAHVSETDYQYFVNAEHLERFQRSIKVKGSVEGFVVEKYRKDKSKIWVSINARSVHGQDEKVAYYEGSMDDITERKLANEALKESESKYRRIVDTANEGIWVLGPDDLTISVNTKMAEMLGFKQEEIIGKPLTAFMFDKDKQDQLLRMKRRRKGIAEIYERGFIRKDGYTLWTLASATPIFDEKHNYKGSFAMFTDITERKHAEDELTKYRQHLEELVDKRTKELSESNSQLIIARDAANAANEAKSRFLANMSHELRTPLNAILGYAQIIKQSTLDERQTKGVNTIANSGEHLLTLISDILDLSKIEAHKLEIHPAVVHFPSFLSTIEDIIRVRAELKNLNFVFETESDLLGGVMADETRLRQVLLNLLGNAVKFTDAGQVVFRVAMLSRKENSAGIRFEVKDTGPGIGSDKLETIFAPFEQAGEIASREGTGLGLAISRQLVHMMDGEICVKSEIGHGSIFWFELNLPLVETEPPVKTIERVVTGYQGPRKKVLIVDDWSSNRSVLVDWLTPLGFKVAEAENGILAIELAKKMHPDLVMIDLMMPQMGGFEAIQEIRKLPEISDTVIIAMSASAYDVTPEECRAKGTDGFLSKPIDWQKLIVVIEKYLHLQWDYQKVVVEEGATETIEQIVPPPSGELEVLYDLTMRGDMMQITKRAKHIESLDKQYIPFARKLQNLAEEFQEKAIKSLVEKYWKRAA